MAGRKRNAPASDSSRRTTRANASPVASSSSRRTRSTAASQNAAPDVYRELILETKRKNAAVASQNSGTSEPPLKRRRPGERPPPKDEPKEVQVVSESRTLAESSSSKLVVDGKNKNKIPDVVVDHNNEDDNDDDIEFEDVVLPPPTIQTMIEESDDDDDDPTMFEDVDITPGGSSSTQAGDQPIELNLTAQKALMNTRRQAERRKVITTEEKRRRVEIHKTHLLCLLSHVEQRNRWCNDPEVHGVLRPLLTGKMMSGLHPRTNQPQFGRSEALKNGIQEARNMFKVKYAITERGLRRSLWAEDEELLKNYQLPDDIESTLEKADFLEAAKSLSGSRDVGAQLFCALLRSAGVDARLVCSLQPLSCVPGAPTMPKPRTTSTTSTPAKPSKADIYAAALSKYETKHEEFVASSTTPSPYRRLGHPNATAYNLASLTPTLPPPPSRPELPTPKKIRGESPFPIYWVEVLDSAYQKWHPVDPLVTCTQWRPRALEPPSSDRENCMTYVVAFEVDGSAKDVTRRYAKAYNSKTRRMRIDGIIASRLNSSVPGALTGERWWRRALRKYSNPWRGVTDLEQIEKNELDAEEAKEPMPRNVADFKDHPVYALERHLRRHEVLVPGARSTGTVGAGSKAPLERIYRRRDVRVARSREKWYRMGRVVRGGEEPVKVLPKRVTRRAKMWGDEEDEGDGVVVEREEEDDPDEVGLFGGGALRGTPIYTVEQTDLYVPPAVRNGRVPKNKFGNVDVYVPSMVPGGGAHVDHERAAQAAFILGVDYAPALTGFRFRGRHGTAVLSGVVVPVEAEMAVRAVIGGLEDLEEERERERRARRALGMWKRWLRVLRIRERVWGVVEGGEDGGGFVGDKEEGGGGFVVSDEEDEDEIGGGGFVVGDEDASYEARGARNKRKGKGKEKAVDEEEEEEDDTGGGGFMVDAEDASQEDRPLRNRNRDKRKRKVVDDENEEDDDGGGGGGGGFMVDNEDVSEEERPAQNKGKGKGKERAVDEEEDSTGGGGFMIDDDDARQEDGPLRNASQGKGKGKAVDDDEEMDVSMGDVQSDVSEEYFMDDDDEGGGFLIE